mgnify:CR=1 FL=1
MATRQNSSNGKPKSPRIQVVLPEQLCEQLSQMAQLESRTVSNMAKVLIQKGVKEYKQNNLSSLEKPSSSLSSTEGFRSVLEAQESKLLKGAPRRIRLRKGKNN